VNDFSALKAKDPEGESQRNDMSLLLLPYYLTLAKLFLVLPLLPSSIPFLTPAMLSVDTDAQTKYMDYHPALSSSSRKKSAGTGTCQPLYTNESKKAQIGLFFKLLSSLLSPSSSSSSGAAHLRALLQESHLTTLLILYINSNSTGSTIMPSSVRETYLGSTNMLLSEHVASLGVITDQDFELLDVFHFYFSYPYLVDDRDRGLKRIAFEQSFVANNYQCLELLMVVLNFPLPAKVPLLKADGSLSEKLKTILEGVYYTYAYTPARASSASDAYMAFMDFTKFMDVAKRDVLSGESERKYVFSKYSSDQKMYLFHFLDYYRDMVREKEYAFYKELYNLGYDSSLNMVSFESLLATCVASIQQVTLDQVFVIKGLKGALSQREKEGRETIVLYEGSDEPVLQRLPAVSRQLLSVFSFYDTCYAIQTHFSQFLLFYLSFDSLDVLLSLIAQISRQILRLGKQDLYGLFCQNAIDSFLLLLSHPLPKPSSFMEPVKELVKKQKGLNLREELLRLAFVQNYEFHFQIKAQLFKEVFFYEEGFLLSLYKLLSDGLAEGASFDNKVRVRRLCEIVCFDVLHVVSSDHPQAHQSHQQSALLNEHLYSFLELPSHRPPMVSSTDQDGKTIYELGEDDINDEEHLFVQRNAIGDVMVLDRNSDVQFTDTTSPLTLRVRVHPSNCLDFIASVSVRPTPPPRQGGGGGGAGGSGTTTVIEDEKRIPVGVDLHSCLVSDSGVSEVNGVFQMQKFFKENGYHYVKEGEIFLNETDGKIVHLEDLEGVANEEDLLANYPVSKKRVKFWMYKAKMKGDYLKWYISIMNEAEEPFNQGIESDIDLWNVEDNFQRTPPDEGWKTLKQGRAPAPFIFVLDNYIDDSAMGDADPDEIGDSFNV
jgi:hypothetical protein